MGSLISSDSCFISPRVPTQFFGSANHIGVFGEGICGHLDAFGVWLLRSSGVSGFHGVRVRFRDTGASGWYSTAVPIASVGVTVVGTV